MKLTARIFTGTLLFATGLSVATAAQALDWKQQMVSGKTAIGAGRYAEAERIYAAAVTELEKDSTTDYRLGLALGQLGMARMALGRHAEAAIPMQRSVAILEAGPEPHPDELATVLQGLGSAFYYQHLYANAERAYQRALDLRLHAQSPDRLSIASLLANLGSVYQIQRRYRESYAALDRARDLLYQTTPADPLFRAKLLNNIATLHRAEGQHGDAEFDYRKALEILEGAQDTDGILTITLLNNLSLECMRRKQYGEAAAALSRAVAKMEAGTALSRTDMAHVLQHYRLCLQKSGNGSEAKRLDSRAKWILSLAAQQPTDGPTIDVSQLGPVR